MISTIQPLVPLRAFSTNWDAQPLEEAIETYLHEHALLSFDQGELVPQIHWQDTREALLEHLATHLNSVFGDPWAFAVKVGMFNHPMHDDHAWIQSQMLIVDIGLNTLKNSAVLSSDLLQIIDNYTYFIGDNPRHIVYAAYAESIE